MYDSITINVSDEIIIHAPGRYGSLYNTTISPKLRIGVNYTMSEYFCLGVDYSELTISYHPYTQIGCYSKRNLLPISFNFISLLVFS